MVTSIIGTLPDEGVSEVGSQGTVDSITYTLRREFSGLNRETNLVLGNLDSSAGSQTYWITEVWLGAPFFSIHFHQSQVRPNAFNQVIYTVGLELTQTKRARQIGMRHLLEVLLGANHHRVVLASKLIHLLEADRIYLVVHI